MQRRDFLRALALLPFLSTTATAQTAGMPLNTLPQERYVDHIPSIPILMFYKVDESPRFPEDISSQALLQVLNYAWQQGYRPVNMSDIILNRVDSVVPKGFKPLGITADGAHASIVFSQMTNPKGTDVGPLHNARSFVEVLGDSAHANGFLPRATFFLSVGSRKATRESSYFGSIMPLKDIADVLTVMPGIEFGYGTRWHIGLAGRTEAHVKTIIEEQMQDFQRLGMLERIARIMAYPFGGKPSDKGMLALRNAHFLGGVLTYPGVGEAHYNEVPQCIYDGKLMMDPFLIPRVGIGSHVYARGNTPQNNPPIDPLADFRKDVERGVAYVSRGVTATP